MVSAAACHEDGLRFKKSIHALINLAKPQVKTHNFSRTSSQSTNNMIRSPIITYVVTE
jgi:hypothetical protein